MSQPNQGFNSSYAGNSINGQTVTHSQAQQISKIGGFVAGGNICVNFVNSSQFR